MAATPKRRGKRTRIAAAGALAATGFAASAAVGAGALGASAAGAATSSKIYACYSTKTDALTYLDYPKVTTCARGETRISWNASGPQGAKGAKGAQGSAGSQGLKGAQGSIGVQGPQGAQASAGSQGTQGHQGAQGAQGAQASAGSQGTQGHQGAQGAQGAQASAGSQGAQGAQGAGTVQGYSLKESLILPPLKSGNPQPTLIARFSPGAGDFDVNAEITAHANSHAVSVDCWAQVKSQNRSSVSVVKSTTMPQVAYTPASTSVNLGVAGFLEPLRRSAGVSLICEATGGGASGAALAKAAFTMTTVSSVTGHTATIHNSFHDPLRQPVTKHADSSTGPRSS